MAVKQQEHISTGPSADAKEASLDPSPLVIANCEPTVIDTAPAEGSLPRHINWKLTAPEACRFTTEDHFGNPLEVDWKPNQEGQSGCVLSIRSMIKSIDSNWVIFKISMHAGSRHDALFGIFADSLEELRSPAKVASCIEHLKNLSETGLVSMGIHAIPGGPPPAAPEAAKTRAITLLKAFRVNTDGWGKGSAKTLENFLREIESGESRLVIEDGRLIREVDVARIDVLYASEQAGFLRLSEDRQIFADGRSRQREVNHAVGGKITPLETSRQCALRELVEELSLDQSAYTELQLDNGALQASIGHCLDYPGLLTRKVYSNFTVVLPEKYFRAEGYDELQPEKRTEFRWKSVKVQ